VIRLDSVGVELGDTTALEDASLSVDAGEFLALVGPNGAGKTTLLRTVNGLLAPTRGAVAVDGRDVTALSAKELGRLVATVPQETSLGFEFAVGDLVRMGRTPHRSRFSTATPDDRAAVEAALARTDTARFADQPVGNVSGGERQRVLLARALAQETPVLALDEPTASLDINHQVRTLSLARDLAAEGKTVIAAIHDLGLAARFCDAVALLDDGRVRAVGDPASVLTSGTLEATFGVRTAVGTDPVTGTRTVTPLSDAPPDGTRVHVVGSGARAARTIGRLADAGLAVSAGVLPEGDVAAETARGLAADIVTAPAFEGVREETRQRAADLATAASVTVVSSLSAPNRALVEDADPVLALEGADVPDAATVAEDELVEAVRGARGVRTVSRDGYP